MEAPRVPLPAHVASRESEPRVQPIPRASESVTPSRSRSQLSNHQVVQVRNGLFEMVEEVPGTGRPLDEPQRPLHLHSAELGKSRAEVVLGRLPRNTARIVADDEIRHVSVVLVARRTGGLIASCGSMRILAATQPSLWAGRTCSCRNIPSRRGNENGPATALTPPNHQNVTGLKQLSCQGGSCPARCRCRSEFVELRLAVSASGHMCPASDN